MAATPHCNIPGLFRNYADQAFHEAFRRTALALREAQIPLTLYPGMEVFAAPNLSDLLAQNKLLTINQGRYLLVEFDFDEDPCYMREMLGEVISRGLRPIIAHPERYAAVCHDPQLIYRCAADGCLIQLNKGSLLGSFGVRVQQTAHRLLRHGLVSVIASDTHGVARRSPGLSDVRRVLAEDYPQQYLKILLEDNPRRICENMPVYRFKGIPFAD